MERLTIDDVIKHCKRITEKYENLNGINTLETADISLNFIQEYWEHRQVKEYLEELKRYRDLEEQGLLLRLSCKVGDTVYCICERYTKCSEYRQVLEEYPCQCCECLECDSHKELYVQPQKAYSLDWIVSNLKRFGKTVFLTKKEAKQKLKEMEND